MYQKPKIGQIELDGWAVLAPMAGVSDLAYRVIARHGRRHDHCRNGECQRALL